MLLDEIIGMATDGEQSVSGLLRKCLVLAYQLKNDRLKAWANAELNGYASKAELPDYRVISAIAYGIFVGPGWSRMQQPIPSALLKPEHRDWATTVHIAQPVQALQHLLDSPGETVFFPWSQNIVGLYQHELLDGWALFSASQHVPKSAFSGIVDTVRTRVLNMALEVGAEVGKRDEDLQHITPAAAAKVEQSVTTNIYGGNVYISGGTSSMNATTIQQHQENIVAGDWEHLSSVLRHSGVSDSELNELSTAMAEDGKTFGSKVEGWIARTAPKILSGSLKIGAQIGQTLLTEYLKQYYGLKQ